MKKSKPEPLKSQKGPSIFGLQRTIDQQRKSAARADKKIATLEKQLVERTIERDSDRQRLSIALFDNRDKTRELKALRQKVDRLEQRVAALTKAQFGHSSEKDESGVASAQAKTSEARRRGQQPGAKGHGRTKRTGLNEDHIDLDAKQQCCETCHKAFKLLPGTDDSTIAEYETMLTLLKYHRAKYARQCKCPGPKIITAPAPPRLYPRTTIGNSLWVHLVVQKFLFGMPTNRTLKDLALQGFGLAAGTVAGGLKVISDLVEPLVQQIILYCKNDNSWHADETSWRVFGERSADKKTNNWWLWVASSKHAVVYLWDRSRSSRVPKEFFANSVGLLMSDRYSAYKSLPKEIRKAWCWVHVRRDFLNTYRVKKFSSWSKQWLLRIATLFVLNEQRFRLWKDQLDFGSVWDLACKRLSSHVEMMKLEWQSELLKPLHKQQKTVLHSLQRHWEGLTLFLNDPRIPLHNNLAERLLRNCVVLRKNSYGSGSEWSGQLAAKFFTLFQTWLINGLDPQSLLLDYFNECSVDPGKPPPSIDKFLPWKMSEDRKLDFALPPSFKRPA